MKLVIGSIFEVVYFYLESRHKTIFVYHKGYQGIHMDTFKEHEHKTRCKEVMYQYGYHPAFLKSN